MPLLYLLAESTSRYWRKKPLEGQEAKTAENGRGVLVEILVTIPLLLAAGYLFRHLPGVITPKNAQSNFFVFAVYTWVIIALHELGHALAGRLMGFELCGLAVFPLEFRRLGAKASVVWNPSLGGHYLGLPRTHEDLWRRHLVMVGGGPLANLVTFLLCWLVLVLAAGRIDGYAFGFLRGLMCWSLVTAVGNLAPLHISGFKTDGRYIWEAFFAPAESRRGLALLGCLTSRSADLRPRDWPAEWVAALRTGPLDAAAAALLSVRAQDALLREPGDPEALADLEATTAALEQAARDLPDTKAAAAFRLQIAWLRCRYDGIVEPGVEATLEQAGKDPTTDGYELLRLQAAIRLASGQEAEADGLLEKAERAIAAQPANGFSRVDLDDVRYLRQQLLAPAATALAPAGR